MALGGRQVSMILGRNQKSCAALRAASHTAYRMPVRPSLRNYEVTISTFDVLWMGGHSEGKPTAASRSQVPAIRRRKGRG